MGTAAPQIFASKMTPKIVLDKNFFIPFLKTSVISVIFTILWIPVFVARCLLVKFLQVTNPTYGKILDYIDVTVEEPYTEQNPKCVLAFTLVINGPLDLKELRSLFIKNVLGAKIHDKKTGVDQPRFPELKQYQTDFAGYRFWKNDETFNVDNHITEQPYDERFSSPPKIHQEALNRIFQKKRSPWEIILVRKYKNNPGKTLLVFRGHHSLGDTKSYLKVLVEGLGTKELKLPDARLPKETILDQIKFYVLLPFYFVYCRVYNSYFAVKGEECPWKFRGSVEPSLHVGISQKLSMAEIKEIAKKHNVTTSVIIMAAMAGGIARSDPNLRMKGIPCQWILPWPNHPNKLCNRHHGGAMILPTDIANPKERLQKCNEIFTGLKNSNLHVYDKVILFQDGTWFNPLRRKFVRSGTFPMMLTNIAGERDGFKIGGNDVEEYTMSCSPMPGSIGVIICAFSYKDGMEISATAKSSILTETQTQKLTELMANEVQVLKNI